MENKWSKIVKCLMHIVEGLFAGIFLICMVAIPYLLNESVREQKRFTSVWKEAEVDSRISRSEYVTITAYAKDKFKAKTATQTKAIPGWTASCSSDLMCQFLGRKIYVEGHGVWKVDDLMLGEGKRIDLMLPTTKEAKKFGTKRRMVVILD